MNRFNEYKQFSALSLVSLVAMAGSAVLNIADLTLFFGFLGTVTGCFVLFSPVNEVPRHSREELKSYSEVAEDILKDIDMQYLQATMDPYTVLSMPDILDVKVPETMAYLSAIDQARASLHLNSPESVSLASAARQAWHRAVDSARRKGVAVVSRETLDTAHHLVDLILHPGTGESERANAVEKLDNIISRFVEPAVRDVAMNTIGKRKKELNSNRAIEM